MFSLVTDYVDKLVREKKLPLLEVLVYKDNKPVYRHHASFESQHSENEPLTMFSCTKVLTAVSGMRLIERGKISLDDPVSKYIPAFEDAYTVDEDGNRHKEVIKVRHLFTMSTGFDYKRYTPALEALVKEKYDTATTTDVVCANLKRPLNFKPGTRFLYSLSHDALGALIETVEGMNLAEYMQKNIFDPLGMNDSTMFSAKYANNSPALYKIVGDGFELEDRNYYAKRHPVKNYVNGGSSLVSTVNDYAIFSATLANKGRSADGYQLLKPETIEKMKEVHFDAIDVNCAFTCVQGKDYGYGLGVRVRTVENEFGIPKGEFGWDGAAGSYTLIDTDNNVCITMGMNILNWPEIFRGEHLAIANLIYKELLK